MRTGAHLYYEMRTCEGGGWSPRLVWVPDSLSRYTVREEVARLSAKHGENVRDFAVFRDGPVGYRVFPENEGE